jgi:CRP-like cAMP-binding protein
MESQISPTRSNRLLAALPNQTYEQLHPSLERVDQPFKQILQTPRERMSSVYFPLSSVDSIVVTMEDGTIVEVATVGYEGMIGLPIFLGSDTMPTTTIVQIPGEAMRMDSMAFFEASRNLAPLRDLLELYTQSMFILVAQSTACNRAHTITQRCARWLLMTQDRVGREQFPLTQEFLSQMLGVRRATVNEVAGALQRAGLIEYHRGSITIRDRAGLEEQSCECYWIIEEAFGQFLII